MTNESLEALGQRLRAVAGAVLPTPIEPLPDVADDVAQLLSALVAATRDSLRADLAWILHAAASGHLPLADDVVDLLRDLELSRSSAEAEIAVLGRARSAIATHGLPSGTLDVVVDRVVVDVSYTSQNDKHTGIQRVTRELCPRWEATHDIVLAAWTDSKSALRRLRPHERHRVLAWADPLPQPAAGAEVPAILVPWHCTLLLPEVAKGRTSRHLAALAEHSGTAVAAVGHDTIPVVTADLRPVAEPNEFVGYLTTIKHTHRVAAVSRSAAAEFTGFAEAVRAQGLPGPEVVEVPNAAEVPEKYRGQGSAATPRAGRRILCVGSHEPHKNHLAVLHAAELLWREGAAFELAFVGGPGWDTCEFDCRLAALKSAGRPIEDLGSVDDASLWSLYREAAFTVFPSLHEGFGLPVVESLASGTPVITSAFGSMAEIAERGGCLLVDPHDDDALAAAMRTLLSNRQVYDRLKGEAEAVTPRSWDTHAAEVWGFLVEGRVPR